MGKALSSLVFFFRLLSFLFIHPLFGLPIIVIGGIFLFKRSGKEKKEEPKRLVVERVYYS